MEKLIVRAVVVHQLFLVLLTLVLTVFVRDSDMAYQVVIGAEVLYILIASAYITWAAWRQVARFYTHNARNRACLSSLTP
jgi:hypothetical protein